MQDEKTSAATEIVFPDLRADVTVVSLPLESVEPNKAALKILEVRRRTLWPRK